MGLFDDGVKVGTGIAIGIGAVILSPLLASVVKPVAKAAIKGGLVAFERGKEFFAETLEVTEDLVAEAKAELAEQHVETVSDIAAIPESGPES